MWFTIGLVLGILIGAANPGSAAWIKSKFAQLKSKAFNNG
jgi:hypothetical protein